MKSRGMPEWQKRKRRKQWKEKRKETFPEVLLKLALTFGVISFCIWLVIKLENGITDMQREAYRRSDSLMFVTMTSHLLNGLVLFAAFFLVGLFTMFVIRARQKAWKIVSGCVLAGVIAGTFAYFYVSYDHYYDITEDAIYYKKGHGTAVQTYSYDEISGAYVSYDIITTKSKQHVEAEYELRMRNGDTFDLTNSNDFVDHLADFDKRLVSEGVPIVRNAPTGHFLELLCADDDDKPQPCPAWVNQIYGLSE